MNSVLLKTACTVIITASLTLTGRAVLAEQNEHASEIRALVPIDVTKDGNSLFIQTNVGRVRLCDLKIVPAGTQYWHWGLGETEQRWLKAGAASEADFSETSKINYFVSLSPVDSANHGENGLVSTTDSEVTEAVNFADFLKPRIDAFQIIVDLKEGGILRELKKHGVDLAGEYTSNPFLAGPLLNWKYVLTPKVLRNVEKISFAKIENSAFFSHENFSNYLTRIPSEKRDEAVAAQISYLELVAERWEIPSAQVNRIETWLKNALSTPD